MTNSIPGVRGLRRVNYKLLYGSTRHPVLVPYERDGDNTKNVRTVLQYRAVSNQRPFNIWDNFESSTELHEGVLRDNSRGLARLHRPEINPSTLALVQYASAAGSNKGNLEGIKQST